MVSRDDTAAMLRLIARWLRGQVARLASRVADSGMNVAERGRVVRALLHSLGILAVFFRCAEACISWWRLDCETGGGVGVSLCIRCRLGMSKRNILLPLFYAPRPLPSIFLNLPFRLYLRPRKVTRARRAWTTQS